MKMALLRCLLLADAAILFLLGAVLIFAPGQVEASFHFQGLPPAVAYLIGLWGCGMATMSLGYVVAVVDPLKHRVWINVAIGRGVLEVFLGTVYLVRGIVTLPQAGGGVLLAAFVSIAYLALYPMAPKVDKPPTPTPSPAMQPSSK
jgi:hypothetical protein